MRTLRTLAAFLLLLATALGAEIRVTILATTDLHGNLLPYDYYAARPAERGLAKIASLVKAARAENPNTLLVDCGDTIQGTPLESVYQLWIASGRLPLSLSFTGPPLTYDPMMLAMNAMGYDAMVAGNHEFNYGLKNLSQARSLARFPWISANIAGHAESEQPFQPYVVKTVGGVKVGIVGMTTPFVPLWETPDHYRGYTFERGVEPVRSAVAALRQREHPDIVIVAVHSGLDRDLKDGARPTDESGENLAYQIATEVQGIDAVVFGHTHQQLGEYNAAGVLLMQPKNWGISLGRMDFILDSGTRKIVSKASRLVPVTASTAADAEIVEIARPYHELAERYLNTHVAAAPVELDAALARVEDSALIDAVQQVQLFHAKADVSFASSFNPNVRVAKGPVTVRQIAALYLYDNQLYAIEGSGKMVREALENAARYFTSCTGDCSRGPLINPQVIGFNYDLAQGVDYEIDLTRPAGQRIRNLRWHGRPLSDEQPLRIAVNNYRAGGSAGYSMFQGARIVWRSTEEIRDMVVRYYIDHKQLPAKPDDNWRIVPEAARRTLREEALAGARNVPLK